MPTASTTTTSERDRNPTPCCVPLDAIADEPVGGKAAGLARLMAIGLRVPPAFVVVHARPDALPADLDAVRARLLGPHAVAVRSSAIGEDSASASFAGQFATILDVGVGEPLAPAVGRCLASLDAGRATAYRRARHGGSEAAMSVVVQRMVDARAAGVLFTADPLTGQRDLVVIDAVRGSGEALVAGRARPDHYRARPTGELVSSDLVEAAPILSRREISALTADALSAARALGYPLDMEWAIDAEDRVHWLQARPITALPGDPNELDAMQSPTDVYTSCNIGECMPGAITPLTLSTVWQANDYSIQLMQVRIGARDMVRPGLHISRLYFGHMFLNLTAIGRSSGRVLGTSDESMALAICGRIVPELDTGPKAPMRTRLANGPRFLRYLLAGQRHEAQLAELCAELSFPPEPDAISMFCAIDQRLPTLFEAFDHHMTASSSSGALEPALLGILARGQAPSAEHHAQLAAWLAAASEHDVESADVVAGVDGIVAALAVTSGAAQHFAEAAPKAALAWLRGAPDGAPAQELEHFLRRHGHQCLRAFELREKEWTADPLPVVASLQAALRARLGPRGASPLRPAATLAAPVPRHLGWLVRFAQSAVRRRERTKSLLIKTVAAFKASYRRLGELLLAEGKLPDGDAVFFLMHEELGRLCRSEGDHAELARRAVSRRAVHEIQATLRFPDVFTRSPAPAGPAAPVVDGEKLLRGKPVSRGTVTGKARVALSLEDAARLEPGEILISPVTDVGWSPYFAVIAGLATDVGSSVSHGAVVAREYGLPAVVDLRRATSVFRTGERVVLDGDRGILRLADDTPPPTPRSSAP